MNTVSHFDDHGTRFAFEPPVEVGDQHVNSLARLGAVAFAGHNASDASLKLAERQISSLIDSLPAIDRGDSRHIAAALDSFLG